MRYVRGLGRFPKLFILCFSLINIFCDILQIMELPLTPLTHKANYYERRYIMSAITIQDRLYPSLAKEKIAAELASFTGGQKEKAISQFAASQLTHFCEESAQFAEVVYKTKRTLSDCCAQVMKGTGNCISDIDVYRGVVRAYFPNADVRFLIDIEINGAPPTEEEMARVPEKPKRTPAKPKAAPKEQPKPAPSRPETIQLSLF